MKFCLEGIWQYCTSITSVLCVTKRQTCGCLIGSANPGEATFEKFSVVELSIQQSKEEATLYCAKSFHFAQLTHSRMRRGVGLTDQLPCDCAVEADSALQEAPLALRYHLHETASGARTGENPTRQTRCNEYLLTRPPSTKSLKTSTAVHHKDM